MPDNLTVGIEWEIADFTPVWRQEISRTASGTQARDLGPMLWHASYQSGPMEKEDAEALQTRLHALRGLLGTFYGHTAQRPRPAKYQSGDMSGITVHSIRADRRALRLTGLPGGMKLTVGDFVSITNDQNGRELLQLTMAGDASSTGLSPWLEVVPHLRRSVDTGQVVQLMNPPVEMQLDPASLTLTRVSGSLHVVSFKSMQVVR